MTGFSIKDKNGVALYINDLDIEAAKFWEKEVEEKAYANPSPKFTNPDNLGGLELSKAKIHYKFNTRINWYDLIGWNIAYGPIRFPNSMGWNDVISSFMGDSLTDTFLTEKSDEFFINHVIMTKQFYQPYIDLIKYWKNKGYTPHRVE